MKFVISVTLSENFSKLEIPVTCMKGKLEKRIPEMWCLLEKQPDGRYWTKKTIFIGRGTMPGIARNP